VSEGSTVGVKKCCRRVRRGKPPVLMMREVMTEDPGNLSEGRSVMMRPRSLRSKGVFVRGRGSGGQGDGAVRYWVAVAGSGENDLTLSTAGPGMLMFHGA
jgi:hypothetical protein